MRCVTRVLLAASTTPEPMAMPSSFRAWLSLPFISSAVETLEFCIPTGYLFRHAQDHQHAHLRSSAKSSLAAQRFTQKSLPLRQQVAVLKRKRPRPSLRKADRVFWVILSYLWPGWRHALVIVRPETVIGWHRKGFRLFWTWKSRRGKPGRPPGVEGNPRSGPRDVSGEHVVGCASDSWGAFEAWLFHLPGHRL